jgi:hypothetical protein
MREWFGPHLILREVLQGVGLIFKLFKFLINYFIKIMSSFQICIFRQLLGPSQNFGTTL